MAAAPIFPRDSFQSTETNLHTEYLSLVIHFKYGEIATESCAFLNPEFWPLAIFLHILSPISENETKCHAVI